MHEGRMGWISGRNRHSGNRISRRMVKEKDRQEKGNIPILRDIVNNKLERIRGKKEMIG